MCDFKIYEVPFRVKFYNILLFLLTMSVNRGKEVVSYNIEMATGEDREAGGVLKEDEIKFVLSPMEHSVSVIFN